MGIKHHRFTATQGEYGLANDRYTSSRLHATEVSDPSDGPLELRVAHDRPTIPAQSQRDVEDDVASSILPLEPAVAIPKATLGGAEAAAGERRTVESSTANQPFGDLVTVRADVRHVPFTHGDADSRVVLHTV